MVKGLVSRQSRRMPRSRWLRTLDKPTDQDWYTLRAPRRIRDPPARATRAGRRDGGRAGLGRADRPALGRRARRSGWAPGDHEYRACSPAASARDSWPGANSPARTPDLPIGKIMQGATTTELGPEILAAYEAPFPTRESKAGAQQFPLLVPLSAEDPGASEMAAVRDALSQWHKPALIAFSDTDPVFPYPRSGEVFAQLLPNAGEQVRIEGAAHFLQEDRARRSSRQSSDGSGAPSGRAEPPGGWLRRQAWQRPCNGSRGFGQLSKDGALDCFAAAGATRRPQRRSRRLISSCSIAHGWGLSRVFRAPQR